MAWKLWRVALPVLCWLLPQAVLAAPPFQKSAEPSPVWRLGAPFANAQNKEAHASALERAFFLECKYDDELRPWQPGFAGVTDKNICARVVPEEYRRLIQLKACVHYPQTGQAVVDAALASWATARFHEDIQPRKGYEGYTEGYDKPHPQGFLFLTTYAVYRPSPRYISVVFTRWRYNGGAHDTWEHEVLSFDLKTGRQLALADLLPRPDTAVPALIKAIGNIPSRNGYDLPSGPSGEVQEGLLHVSATNDDIVMRRLALTPQGLTVVFGPYEKASFMYGTVLVDIPRKELPGLGVASVFWQKPAKRLP